MLDKSNLGAENKSLTPPVEIKGPAATRCPKCQFVSYYNTSGPIAPTCHVCGTVLEVQKEGESGGAKPSQRQRT
jgi:uncharacterized protein (DUF983 family)